MKVTTETSALGKVEGHPWGNEFTILTYEGGGLTFIPHGFFRNFLDHRNATGQMHIGKCSKLGVGSFARFDGHAQRLVVGRYVDTGCNVQFILGGQHDIKGISNFMFGILNQQGLSLGHRPMPNPGDMVLENDIWVGHDAMFLGGCRISNGCVIGARALVPMKMVTEPYGIYAGQPARLVRFRFPERVRELLLELAWWDLPLSFIEEHMRLFCIDLTQDEGLACELLTELISLKSRAQSS